MSVAINDAAVHDEVERFGRCLVEFSGGPGEGTTGMSLISVGGLGVTVNQDSTTIGPDSQAVSTACKATLRNVELVICMTENHTFIPDWWKAMNEDGNQDKVFKTMSIKFHGREGNLVRQIDYADVWMMRWELCESDSNARNEFCVLRVTISVGYTTGGLLK
jgi:hypothetical protein